MDTNVQGTDRILVKVLLQGTALQGTAYVESTVILSDAIPTVNKWANGNFLGWAFIPSQIFFKPITILSNTFYLIQIFYSNHLSFFHENFSFITDHSFYKHTTNGKQRYL